MNFEDLVKKRRSIRSYTNQEIPREHLTACCSAARLAPSACNSQPWKFLIIDDPALKQKISNSVISGVYNMNSFASSANAFIAVISEKVKLPSWLGSIATKTDFRSIDIGMACQNLLLQAESLGIGTCVLGWFDKKKLSKLLNVPSGKDISLLISLGYPGKNPSNRNLKEKNETVNFNSY